jgi:hypothetical protein
MRQLAAVDSMPSWSTVCQYFSAPYSHYDICNASPLPPQAVDAVKRHHAAGTVVSQLIEEAPPAELAHGIDDMSPTGALTAPLATGHDGHANAHAMCASRHLTEKLSCDIEQLCCCHPGSCRKEVEAFCLGVEPGERHLANCLQHQLDQEAQPGLQPGENKW